MKTRIFLALFFCSTVYPIQAGFINPYIETKQSHEVNAETSAAATKLAQGDIEGARQMFEMVLLRSPNDTAAILGLADIAYLQHRQDQVKDLLLRALKKEPNNAGVQTAIGRFRYLNNEINQAIIHFEQATKLDHDLPDPEIELASLYATKLKDPLSSANHYARAVVLAATNVNIRYGYASVLSSLGNLDKALQQLTVVEKQEPRLAYTYQLKGTILTAHGRSQLALNAFDQALSIDPENLQPLWAKAEIHSTANRHAAALAAYQKIVRKEPRHAVALTKVGLMHQFLGDFEQAEEFYKRAIEADPSIALAFNNLAYGTASIKGREDEALKWAQRAVELQPKNPMFVDTLAMTYEAIGDIMQAKAILKTLIEQFPAFPDGRYRLARLYDRSGNETKAINLYLSILEKHSDDPRSAEIREYLSRLRK